jgi:glycosyltransferase involved in cell wall biosynthesis
LGNEAIAVRYLQNKLQTPSIKDKQCASLLQFYDREQVNNLKQLEEKEWKIRDLDFSNQEFKARDEIKELEIKHLRDTLKELHIELQKEREILLSELEKKELEIKNLDRALKETRIELEKTEELIRFLHDTDAEMNKTIDCKQQGFQQQINKKENLILDLQKSFQTCRFLVNNEEKGNSLNHILWGYEHKCKGLQIALEEKEKVIAELSRALHAYRSAFFVFGFLLTPIKRILNRTYLIFKPRLGNLYQHVPRILVLPQSYQRVVVTNNPIRISLVTPSYCQSKFIERTIQSVLDQDYPNLEYVVQDGGSKDGTREILAKYSHRLTEWESASDSGQSYAINRGFSKTTGEIMAWLNSDDILLPGSLAYVAEYFYTHPKIDVVYGNRFLIDEEDNLIGRWVLPKHDSKVLSWADFIPQETLFWRRRIWEKVGGKVDESFQFAIDWDLLLRFRDAGAVFHRLPRFLGGFRVHPQQKTSANISDIGLQEMNRIRERIHGRIPSSLETKKALAVFMGKHVVTDLHWRIRRAFGVPY